MSYLIPIIMAVPASKIGRVGRVSIINGDRTIISTARLICQDELVFDNKTGILKNTSIVKIQSDVDHRIYQICGCEHSKISSRRCSCDRWITTFKDQVIRPRVVNTPTHTHIPHPPAADQPRTPAPLPRTRTLLNLNLPPLPPQLLLFAQQTPK